MYESRPLPKTPCTKGREKVFWWKVTIDDKKCFMKRNTEPSEFEFNEFNHRLFASVNTANIIRNEKLALDYIRKHTSIPVPKVVFYLDEGSRVYLATEFVEGVELAEIEDPAGKQKAIEQVDAYVRELETHKSNKIRGFGFDICLPPCAEALEMPSTVSRFPEYDDERFVLCHGDLHDSNVIVDPKTFEVKAIIDWEYAGFYPPNVDPRRYKYGDGIVHPADGSFMTIGEHSKMARNLLCLARFKNSEPRAYYIEKVDGVPKLKGPVPCSMLPKADTDESPSETDPIAQSNHRK